MSHYLFSVRLASILCVLINAEFLLAQDEIVRDLVIDFESVTVGKPITEWSEKGLTIKLAHQPRKSKSVGKISFFPHLGTGRKGVVNAMANEAIPIRVSFEKPAKQVELVLWGSTTSSALLEAYDDSGKLLGKKSLEHVPVRSNPEEQIPFFKLDVSADAIAYLEISGSKPGGFLAIDEIRWISFE